jgi:hypothetical protein
LNPTITLEFTEDAAKKFADFQHGSGAGEWNTILRAFENVLGAAPTVIKTANVPGNITLTPKVLAGAGR